MGARTVLAALFGVTGLLAQGDNILVIVADDLGVDYVNAYAEGTNPPPTPNMDSLASGGVLFRNAYAYPSCSPSRASLMTGRYAFRTLVGRWILHSANPPNVGLLQPEEWTLPEVLDMANSGYAHALIGKWHLGNVASSLDGPRTIGGWSHYAGSLVGQIPSYTNWTRVVDGVPALTSNYCTTQNTDDALAWIQSQATPWLCVLTYQAPHVPYHAPPAHLHTQNLAGLTPQSNHTPANIPFYRAMVESLDTEMGRLFTTLGPAVLEDTNIIFVADNGTVQQQSVAPFSGSKAKGTPFEGGVNVPLLVKGPIVQQPGREVDALCSIVDVFQTVLDLAGASGAVPPFVENDSVSLVPYLTNASQPALRTHAYSEEFTGTAWPAPNQNGYAIVRDDRFKLIHYYNSNTDRLYDLQVDPFENSNLINSSNPIHQQARVALQAEIDLLRAQAAGPDFVVFGNGNCVGSTGVPQISGNGFPVPGLGFNVELTGAPSLSFAAFAFGASWQTWGVIPLPLNLSVVGAHPDCLLSSSAEVLLLAITGFTGASTQFVAVPSNGSLVGQAFYSSWVVLDNAAPNNPAGLVSTNALAARIRL